MYARVMVRNELIEEILRLDASDREYVRDVVMASLTEDLPPQLSPAEQQEVVRRVQAYDANPQSYLTWEHVKGQLAAQRAGRGK
jgi:putative addiction module component (TIGR02574 family)